MIQSSFVIHSLYVHVTCRLGLKGKVDVTLQIKVHVYMYIYNVYIMHDKHMPRAVSDFQ